MFPSSSDSEIEPAHGTLVLIAHAQMPHVNAYTDVSVWARGRTLGLNLPSRPYFGHARSEGSDETGAYAQTRLRFRCSPMR